MLPYISLACLIDTDQLQCFPYLLSLLKYPHFKVLLVHGGSELCKVCPRPHETAVWVWNQCDCASTTPIPENFGAIPPNSNGHNLDVFSWAFSGQQNPPYLPTGRRSAGGRRSPELFPSKDWPWTHAGPSPSAVWTLRRVVTLALSDFSRRINWS